MELSPLTSARRPEAVRPWGRAADAFETVAWRPPSSARFDARVANDADAAGPTTRQGSADLPAWVTIIAGGVVAALMGVLVGGALAL